MNDDMAEVHLNCRRLLCPLPVIRVQDAVKQLQPGQKLIATCTDPGVKHDIPAWCRVHGYQVSKIEELEGDIIVTIDIPA